MSNDIKIKYALNDKSSTIECLPLIEKYSNELENSYLLSLSDKGISSSKTLEIYKRRQQHLSASGIETDGLNELIKYLKDNDEPLKTALYKSKTNNFSIFISEDLTKIFGIVKTPIQKNQ